jgi:L,D-peptidoglycan transpeptidase YkuD (ErfK/YbiS/YcfS/YnhG family)
MVAATVGAVALVVAVGAAIAATFPRPAAPNAAATPVASAAASKAHKTRTQAIAEATAKTAPKSVAAKPAASTSSTPTPNKAAAPAKPAPAKPAAVAPAPVLPLGMKTTLPGSRQMVIATGPKLGATHGTLRVFNLVGGSWKQVLSAPCRFGTYGLVDGTKRKQGSRMTPTGIWWPGTWVWGWHPTAPAGTKMPYRQTTQNVWWSAEPNSTYNTWVVSANHVNGEHLVDVRIQYEYAWSSGYNAPPNQSVQGRGTAIFLHVFDPPDFHNGLSAGCIGVSRSDIVRVFKTLDPALKPSFAIGTETPGTPTSISAYCAPRGSASCASASR